MKLSIIMPSHNVGAQVNINIMKACSMGSDDVEIVIRDNSGDEEKRKFLSQINGKNCRILSVDECPIDENYKSLMNEARGEFAFLISDDDLPNGFALPAIIQEIERVKGDASIIGITGISMFDEAAQTNFALFKGFDSQESADRMKAFFGEGWHSLFQFLPLRLSVLQDVWNFWSTTPLFLSYHDLLIGCLVLSHGRTTHLNRCLYSYHNTNWVDEEMHLSSHARYFRRAGLDTSATRFLWLMAAFEGAQTFLHKYKGAPLSSEQREALGFCWFEHWFKEFTCAKPYRKVEDARFDLQALKLVEKWSSTREIRCPEILTDIAEHFSLSSPELAQRYYDFWK